MIIRYQFQKMDFLKRTEASFLSTIETSFVYDCATSLLAANKMLMLRNVKHNSITNFRNECFKGRAFPYLQDRNELSFPDHYFTKWNYRMYIQRWSNYFPLSFLHTIEHINTDLDLPTLHVKMWQKLLPDVSQSYYIFPLCQMRSRRASICNDRKMSATLFAPDR